MSEALEAVGVCEAKNRFSGLTALVNQTGAELVVLKGGRPWVVIQPADAAAEDCRTCLDRLRALTGRIEGDAANESGWDSAASDLTGPVLDGAFLLEGPDLEDGIVRAAAEPLGAEAIVARDSSAFRESSVPAMDARAYCEGLG